jgi:tRNA-2-methylthio-N6-dimethylallyladenosine synthase
MLPPRRMPCILRFDRALARQADSVSVAPHTAAGSGSKPVKGAKYYLETFGCQMNVLDSQLVEAQLRRLGLERVTDHRQADIILFNTCSVRRHAEDKVLSRLGSLRARKLRRPHTIVGLIGCMAELEGRGLFAKMPHLDLLCGPGELDRLPALLAQVWERREKVAALSDRKSRGSKALLHQADQDRLEALDRSRCENLQDGIVQAYVRVQRGCDKFCTYCVVPFTRGPERSRPAEHIVEEVRQLVRKGCREVTLLGQTVNSYRSEQDGRPVGFAELLERVQAVEGIDRVRFVTSFPADWDEDIFRVMRDYPKIMPYLHIPAQSGSDRVLRQMRRGYNVAQYLDLIDTARKYLPHISLAGDFIVGFCGETEEDFRASLELLHRVEYDRVFVFKYSPRPGTVAERRFCDDVPLEVKARRNNELLSAQAEISYRRNQRFVGRTVEVLVEGYSKLAKKRKAGEEPHWPLVGRIVSRKCPAVALCSLSDALKPITSSSLTARLT